MRAGGGGREKTGGSPVINLQVVGWTQHGPDGTVWMSRSAERGEGAAQWSCSLCQVEHGLRGEGRLDHRVRTSAHLDLSHRCLNQDTPQQYGSQNSPTLQSALPPPSLWKVSLGDNECQDHDPPDPLRQDLDKGRMKKTHIWKPLL